MVVNISPSGLMARCDAPIPAGERLAFQLPGLRAAVAEVRWALGGRIGCEFDAVISPSDYYALLPKLAC